MSNNKIGKRSCKMSESVSPQKRKKSENGPASDISVACDGLLKVDESIFAVINLDHIEQTYWNNNSKDKSCNVAGTKKIASLSSEKKNNPFSKRKFSTLSLNHKQDSTSPKLTPDSEKYEIESVNTVSVRNTRVAIVEPVTNITPKLQKFRQLSQNKSRNAVQNSHVTKAHIKRIKINESGVNMLGSWTDSENNRSSQETEKNQPQSNQTSNIGLADSAIPLSLDVNAYNWNENLTQMYRQSQNKDIEFVLDGSSDVNESPPGGITVLNSEDIDIDAFTEEFTLNNHEWDHDNQVTDGREIVDSVSEGCHDDLSQFYESSQVLRQIENVISTCDAVNESTKTTNSRNESLINNPKTKDNETVKTSAPTDISFSNIVSQPTTSKATKITKSAAIKKVINKIKEHEDNWDDIIASGISQLFKSTQYKREVAGVFNNLETSICHIAEGQDISLQKDTTLNHTNVVNNTINGINWTNDSITNFNQIESQNISNLVRRTLANITMNKVQPTNTTMTNNNNSATQIDQEFFEMGPFYGLPLKVKELIQQYKGIDGLYDWQDECLKLEAIRKRKNLVYALPTSGGKTLVSEILILREIMCRKHNVLFVLPYVSIVQEKVWALSPFALALDFLVEEYAAGKGGYPPRKRRHRHSVYIATIEKALGLVNSLMETDRLNEIGLVVVDELHLVGEQGRGPTLESLLTKLMYTKENIHIVGMSATIGNLPEVCTFLKSEGYTKDFRPVELKEYVKCENQIYEVNRKAKTIEESLVAVRTVDFQYSENVTTMDPDKLTGLVMEVVPAGSCLVFCATKKNCENVAQLLCRIMFRTMLDHKKTEKEGLLKLIKGEGTLCPILKRTLPFGVAYHHSGLTSDERRIIEDAFRVGTLCVICCTSTLAAGVNLPAKRVLLRSPYVGRDFINLARYKQMAGRAGRAGLGEIGESILVCDPRDFRKVAELLCSPMDQVESKMCENDLKGIRDLTLSCIALGTAQTRRTLRQVTNCSLLAVQEQRLEKNVKKATDQAITELFKLGALQLASDKSTVSDSNVSVILQSTLVGSPVTPPNRTQSNKKQVIIGNDSKLVISKLGKAAIKGGLDLDTAHILYEDLVQAQASLVLLSCLHLLYLVTPYELARQLNPSLPNYYSIYVELGIKELQTARVLGLNEACEAGLLAGRRIKTVNERVLNRFYLTLMLYDLWNEKPVFEVAEKYQVSRGIVQQLMVSAATFASNVMRFCEQLDEFWVFTDLLNGMSHRLQHCSSKELIPLMDLPSVKQGRARQLFRAGYKSLQSIARANPTDLMNNIEHMSRRIANQLIASAKLLLLEKVENLREEAEDVLDGIELPRSAF